MTAATIICVLAHNEEARIARCLASLPCGQPGIAVHVAVNGSRDRTAAIARAATAGLAQVTVHDWAEGGKARSWNRLVLDTIPAGAAMVVLVDGDAEVAPGSIAALAAALSAHPGANAAAAMPGNGRRAAAYREQMVRDHGLFGDLYALRGDFVDRMRAAAIRLPDDVIGDDGLVAALARCDLQSEANLRPSRVVPTPDAAFLCDPVSLWRPASLMLQYRRMRSYALRRFQNRIITAIMRGPGPAALPPRLAGLYPDWLDRLTPRRDPRWWWFDRLALARMRAEAAGAAEAAKGA